MRNDFIDRIQPRFECPCTGSQLRAQSNRPGRSFSASEDDMNMKTLGAIAFASTLTLACTTTTETVTTEPGPDTPATKPDSFKSKLALSKSSRKSSIIGALAAKAGQQTGGTHLKSGPGGGGSCGLSSGDPTCDSCLDTSCCTENKACVADPDCNALIACGDACRDDACISACMSA